MQQGHVAHALVGVGVDVASRNRPDRVVVARELGPDGPGLEPVRPVGVAVEQGHVVALTAIEDSPIDLAILETVLDAVDRDHARRRGIELEPIGTVGAVDGQFRAHVAHQVGQPQIDVAASAGELDIVRLPGTRQVVDPMASADAGGGRQFGEALVVERELDVAVRGVEGCVEGEIPVVRGVQPSPEVAVRRVESIQRQETHGAQVHARFDGHGGGA